MTGEVRPPNARLVRATPSDSTLDLCVEFRAGLREAERATLRLWDPEAAHIDERYAPASITRRGDGGLSMRWSLGLATLFAHEPANSLREVVRNIGIEFGGERRARLIWDGHGERVAHFGARSLHLLPRAGGDLRLAIVRRRHVPASAAGSLRIAVLIQHLLSDTGKTRALIDIADGLAQVGHSVTVVLKWFNDQESPFSLPEGVGFAYAEGPFRLPPDAPSDWRDFPDEDARYAGFLGSLDVDCAIHGGPFFELIRGGLPGGTSLIFSDHDGRRVDLLDGDRCEPAFFDALRTHDAVHVVNAAIAARVAPLTARPVVTIPNSIKIDVTTPDPATLFPTRRFVAVGRFTRGKRMGHVVAAFARIAARLPGWRLDLFGTGDEFERVAEQAARTAAADRIVLHGFEPEVGHQLARGAVMVSASKHEAFGLAVAEAMAAGCPVVAYDRALGHQLLLGVDAGVLVPDGNKRALATAMLAIAQRAETADPALLAMTVRARARLAEFAPVRVRQAWADLVSEVCTRRG